MKLFPSSKDEQVALLLFPFKAYLVVFYPFYRIFRIFCPQPFLGTMVGDGTFGELTTIGCFCVIALFIGGILQLIFSGWGYALSSLAFAVVPVVVVFALRLL